MTDEFVSVVYILSNLQYNTYFKVFLLQQVTYFNLSTSICQHLNAIRKAKKFLTIVKVYTTRDLDLSPSCPIHVFKVLHD